MVYIEELYCLVTNAMCKFFSFHVSTPLTEKGGGRLLPVDYRFGVIAYEDTSKISAKELCINNNMNK